MGKQTAQYTAKIFQGAKRAELPVEQPVALELALNLRTAAALGLSIPAAVIDGPGRAHPLWDDAAGALVGHRHRVETLFPSFIEWGAGVDENSHLRFVSAHPLHSQGVCGHPQFRR